MHSMKIQDGGVLFQKIGELSLVDSDSTQQEEHTYISLSSEWVFCVRRLWTLEILSQKATFSAIMSIFSPLEASRPSSGGLNENWDLELMYDQKEFGISCTPPSYDSWNRNSRFFRF